VATVEVFVVRMWPDPDNVCGVVEHVSSGRTLRFTERDAFWAFLADAGESDPATPSPHAAPAPRLLQE
jgi:hypothetical protein